jgi:hypothetical protein
MGLNYLTVGADKFYILPNVLLQQPDLGSRHKDKASIAISTTPEADAASLKLAPLEVEWWSMTGKQRDPTG